ASKLSCSAVASFGASLVETMLTFGSQSRNAQMAYNNSFVMFASVTDGSRKNVPLTRVQDVWGPGAEALLVRNFLSVMAVRSLSPWLKERIPGESRAKAALCDVSSSLVTCTVTAPVHQLFNFLATTPEAKQVSLARRASMARKFLREQYFVPLPREVMITDFSRPPPQQEYSWRISPVALRDFGMRSVYITTVFTLFVAFERTLCGSMR
ncbi:DPOL, partial [Symbiodinium pilosum]